MSIYLSVSLYLSIYLFFSPTTLRAHWTERNQIDHMVGSAIWKRLCEIWGSPSPTNRGSKNHPFRRLRNLTATSTAPYSEQSTPYIIGQIANYCTKGSPICYIASKRHELWSIKLDVSFHPPSVNSLFFFIARLRRWRSVNGTQQNVATRWTVNRTTICRRKVGFVPPQKLGAKKTLYMCSVFDDF